MNNTLFPYIKDLSSTWPVLQALKNHEQLIADLKPHVDFFKHFTDVLILGTGGSSLGGQAVTALRSQKASGPNLHFIDNIDSHTFARAIQTLNPATTGVLTVSKSGNTAETLMQTLTLLQNWDFTPADHMRILTEPHANAMRELAATYNIPCIDHPINIGGRFSVFSAVGILPALIAGLDGAAFCKGALDAYNTAIQDEKVCSSILSALAHAAYGDEGINQIVLLAYADRLEHYTEWFCQLWAESVGKKDASGKSWGTTPVRALGTVDQHSQVQLYLDGPRDKHFTVIVCQNQTALAPITLDNRLSHPAITTLNSRSMGDLMIAEQKATIDTLRNNNRPVRVIEISDVNEANLGSLMMHAMLETLMIAKLWGVNPFDQPAVEEGKIRALKYLKEDKKN